MRRDTNPCRQLLRLGCLLPMLGGCLQQFPVPPTVASVPINDPMMFFAGRTRGDGHLDVRIGTDRHIRVEGTGDMLPDGRLRLVQVVTRDSGDAERRTWFMQRLPGNQFSATLTDATGEVQGEVRGSLCHLRYRIRQPAVYMEQWMYLQPDGRTVRNFAQVTILGVPWARLTETITRVQE